MKWNGLSVLLITILCVIVFGDKTTGQGSTTGKDKEKKEDLYSIKLTGIQCYNIDPHLFTNITCKLKAVRGKQGVLNLFFIYNNIPKLTTAYQLYYRNGNGRYMLYIINVWIDYCKIVADNMGLQSTLAKLLLNLWYKFDSAVPNGCPSKRSVWKNGLINDRNRSDFVPVNGAANYTNFEMDQFKHFIFPSIIPAGDYAFYIRNYETGTNRSIMDIQVKVNVKAKTIMELSMLNMG